MDAELREAADEILEGARYDPATAKFLSGMVGLAYQQFANPSWNGQIPASLVPAGYAQVAAFSVPELDLDVAVDRFLQLHPELMPLVATDVMELSDADATALNAHLSTTLQDPAVLAQLAVGFERQWFGFALKPVQGNPSPANVVAIRGTRTAFEWAIDATAVQVPVPLGWFSNGRFRLARVHLGFLILFAFLAEQMSAAADEFDKGLLVPTQVAGHSLGSALATLSAIWVKLHHLFHPVKLYLMATPRVGNDAFVSAFNFFVPAAFSIVNLSDLVPELPPTSATVTIRGHTVSVQYGNVGTEWSYLWQTGNVGTNHAWQTNYDPAIQAKVPTSARRSYPNTGIPC
jgi:hypothetical protein